MRTNHQGDTKPNTQHPDPQATIPAVAERGLCSSRYSALKHVSCDYQSGVLVLKGMGRLDNQIHVVRPAPRWHRGRFQPGWKRVWPR